MTVLTALQHALAPKYLVAMIFTLAGLALALGLVTTQAARAADVSNFHWAGDTNAGKNIVAKNGGRIQFDVSKVPPSGQEVVKYTFKQQACVEHFTQLGASAGKTQETREWTDKYYITSANTTGYTNTILFAVPYAKYEGKVNGEYVRVEPMRDGDITITYGTTVVDQKIDFYVKDAYASCQ